jgi:hypothetical protein
MSRHLAEAGLLAPWVLECVEGETVARLENLWVVPQMAYEEQRLRSFLQRFGSAGVNLLGSHRLSLFRAGVIVGSARKAMRRLAHAKLRGDAVPP